MSVIIRQCTVAEIEAAPNFSNLLDEYATYAIPGMPSPAVKMEHYRLLEKSGVQTSFGAFLGTTLVGFINVLVSVSPHYGITGAYSESLFVAKEYRKLGAGLRLIRAAEAVVKEKGAPGLIISAPAGSPLTDILPEIDYRQTHILFFKRLENV